MGILRMEPEYQNLRLTINDYIDVPTKTKKLVKENYISDFDSFKSFNTDKRFTMRTENTLKPIQRK